MGEPVRRLSSWTSVIAPVVMALGACRPDAAAVGEKLTSIPTADLVAGVQTSCASYPCTLKLGSAEWLVSELDLSTKGRAYSIPPMSMTYRYGSDGYDVTLSTNPIADADKPENGGLIVPGLGVADLKVAGSDNVPCVERGLCRSRLLLKGTTPISWSYSICYEPTATGGGRTEWVKPEVIKTAWEHQASRLPSSGTDIFFDGKKSMGARWESHLVGKQLDDALVAAAYHVTTATNGLTGVTDVRGCVNVYVVMKVAGLTEPIFNKYAAAKASQASRDGNLKDMTVPH